MMKKNNGSKRIIVKGISKQFRIGCKKKQSALSYFISFFSGIEPKREFWALKKISFVVRAGENLGIIGRNGCGKTTLLGAMVGIYEPERGRVEINGKTILLSSMATGIKPRLTIRDNIPLVGSLFGLGKKEIRKNFNSIIKFAGLEDFVDTKLYQLSSGMRSRLNFSITIHFLTHSKPDVLLLDEVFGGGGGDAEFQNKGLARMEELVEGGVTVVLASHSMNTVKKYCDKVIWLEEGKIVMTGKPKKVVNAYLSFIEDRKARKNAK